MTKMFILFTSPNLFLLLFFFLFTANVYLMKKNPLIYVEHKKHQEFRGEIVKEHSLKREIN